MARRGGTGGSNLGDRRIVYVVRSFPRLSQTFILNELVAIEAHGVDARVLSIVRADERQTHAQLDVLRAPITFLSELADSTATAVRAHALVAAHRPLRYVRALRATVRRTDRTEGYHTLTGRQAFHFAVVATAAIGGHRRADAAATRLHAHFAHDPALVAMLVHDLSGVPFSFTGHARDLTQIAPSALAERVAKAADVVTICELNAQLLRSLDPPPAEAKIHLVYNGVDLGSFVAGPHRREPGALRIGSIGRLVDKKGFEVLIAAGAELRRRAVAFELDIYGTGPLHDALQRQIDEAGIADAVRLCGERTQQELQGLLPGYDAFALTPYVTDDGDRDGLPTVLVEAMACARPVVSTDVAGIPDLVHHGHNGLLTPPKDPIAVADALHRLAAEPPLRAELGDAARATVEAGFDLRRNTRQLASLLTGP